MRANSEVIAEAQRSFLGNYRPAPLVLVEGRGRHVQDVAGVVYLDLSGGAAVTSVGHAHPRLAAAIAEQAGRLIHVSNNFFNERAIALASRLTARSGFARVFFCNSGTEANEAVIKLARRFHHARGQEERVHIVAATGSFHGRSLGSLSLTGQERYKTGMEPLLGAVTHVPFNDVAALQATLGKNTAALILEPIQGDGGIVEAKTEYLRAARRICDETGTLLFCDEVQTGYGRSGRFLCSEWSGVKPDGCSIAKGMAGGFPMGALLVREELGEALPPGAHGCTFGGNPLASAAAMAVLDIFEAERLVENAYAMGELLRARLLDWLAHNPACIEVRGRGLLQGLVLDPSIDMTAVLARLRDKRVLLTAVSGNVVRFSPALNVTQQELGEGLAAVEAILRDPPRRIE